MPLAPEVLALAQQGNPQVLSAVINHAMRTYGVRAQVMRREPDLHILLEADQVPEEESAVSFVESLLRNLGVASAESVLVYGYRTGEKEVAWKRSLSPPVETPSPAQLAQGRSPAENPHEPEQLAEIQETAEAGELSAVESGEVIETSPVHQSDDLTIPTSATLAEKSLEDLELVNPFVLSPDDPIVEPAMPEEEFVKLVKAEVVEEKHSQALVPQELAQHPESVVLLVMLSLFVIWRFYLELLGEPENALTTGQLAQRLGVKRKLVRYQKYQANFAEWSRSLDPDGVSWQWQEGRFRPVM